MATSAIDFSQYEDKQSAPATIDFSQYEQPAPDVGKPTKGGMPTIDIDKKKPIDRMIDWLRAKKEAAADADLKKAAAGEAPTGLNPTVALAGMGEDTANLVKNALSLKGLATAGATAAAPEVMLPVLAGQGVKTTLTPQQEGETGPDALQRRLLGASQVVGAAAGGEAIRQGADTPAQAAVRASKTAIADFKVKAAARAATAADDSILQGLGPTKSNPITSQDVKNARPYLESEHASTPIQHVEGLRDASDAAIGKIEGKVQEYIAANPQDTIAGHATPIADVKAALGKNITKGFTEEGLKAIDKYPVSDDMTVADADKVRNQLNAENRASMKSKNNYDVANMRQTDPAFAAREALANSLRQGVYDKLEQRGIQGVQQLRQDEGSLIKIRNGAESRIYSSDKGVSGTATAGVARRVAGRMAKTTATGLGAAGGAAFGGLPGAAGGAALGAEVGEAVRQGIAPGNLTRDQLIERAFKTPQTQGAQYPAVPPKPQVAGQLGQGPVNVKTGQPFNNQMPPSGTAAPTQAEATAAAASQKAANTPSVRIIRNPETGRLMKQYLTAGEGKVYYEEPVGTKGVRPNASGESSASQEAINRVKYEKQAGIKRFKIDTRSGNEVPLTGVDAVDAKPGSYDVIVQRGPNGETVLDAGNKAKPYRPKGSVK
jgi:hypothetical protein